MQLTSLHATETVLDCSDRNSWLLQKRRSRHRLLYAVMWCPLYVVHVSQTGYNATCCTGAILAWMQRHRMTPPFVSQKMHSEVHHLSSFVHVLLAELSTDLHL